MLGRLFGRNRLQGDPLLPGVPLVESPFFDDHVEKLSPAYVQIARDLNRQGYAVFAFPDPDIIGKIDGIKRDFASRYDWESWRAGKIENLRVQDAWREDQRVRDIAANPAVLELLSAIYGRRAFPFQTLTFPVGTQQAGHADYVHFNSIPERFMCGVWLAFEDIDEDNGPLFYYPGSHKWPCFQSEHLGISHRWIDGGYAQYPRYVALWERLAKAQGLAPAIFRARKGEALIWAANLVHGGSPQKDITRTRWSQVTHYFFEGCAYTTPLANDVYNGRVFYREIVDVGTGQPVRNVVSGEPVAGEVIDTAQPDLETDLATRIGEARARFALHPDIPPGFDAAFYLAAHPDLIAAGADPYHHYVTYGKAEGRRYKPD
jgi:hypothetical protein